MESGEPKTGSDLNQPGTRRVLPPPLPPTAQLPESRSSPLSYRATPPNAGWTLVRSYPSAGKWHAANKLLSTHGIIAQMRVVDGEPGGYELLVIQTEAEWAADLLARDKTADEEMETPTRGFPVYDSTPPGSEEKTSGRISESMPAAIPQRHIPAIPVEIGLSDRQKATYEMWIILLWILMGVIILLMGLFAIFETFN
jgi:hypothetical protein